MTGFRAELPHGLAALRIAIASAVLVSPELWQARELAAQPAALRFAPEGLDVVLAHVPITVELAAVAQAVTIASCLAAIAGVAARLAMGLITACGLYAFGLSQLSGAVIHDMHLFWFSLLLSVSRCGDAFTVRRHRPSPGPSLTYGVPLQLSRMLLAVVYFFPGFWKLRTSGLAWITSDNLRNQLYWKWYQLGLDPPWLRLDLVPFALQALALAVIVFELGFVLLIWTKRGRVAAAIGGAAFHVGTQWLMGITFASLVACYVVLLPWERWRRLQQPRAARRDPPELGWTTIAVGVGLVAITSVQGARGATQSWPFGCYPTFDRIVGPAIGDLRIEAVRPDGSVAVIPDGPSTGGPPRSSRDWARAWRLAGMYGGEPDPDALRAYWRRLRRHAGAANAARGAHRLRFYAATYSVLPRSRGEPPLAKHYLGELRLR